MTATIRNTFVYLWLHSAITASLEVVVSKDSTCSLHLNEIRCWGHANYGQLAGGNTVDLYEPPTTPITFHDGFVPKSMDCGEHHCCAISLVDSAICWGQNSHGRCGRENEDNIGDDIGEMGNNLTIIDLGTDFFVDHISCGGRHSCALSTNNELKCFGLNNYGQLGIGSTEDIGDEINEMGDNMMTVDLGSDFVPIRVECGGYFTCVISSKFELKCFGRNDVGELGMGDTNHRGDSVDEMGDNLHPIDLGTGFMVSSVQCGEYHVCALSTTQSIKCFGSGKFGILGLGDVENRGDDPNEMGDYLEIVDLGSDFVPQFVGTGGYYSFAVSTTGALKAWGYGERLGYGSTTNVGNELNEMGDYLPEVDLGSGYNVNQISSGSLGDHTCVLIENGTDFGVKCYGRNLYGQLGLSDTVNRGDGIDEMGDHLPFVEGLYHTQNPTLIPTANPTTNPSLQSPPTAYVTSDAVHLESTINPSESTDSEVSGVQSSTVHSDHDHDHETDWIESSVDENGTNLMFVIIVSAILIVVLLILSCVSIRVYLCWHQRKMSDGTSRHTKLHAVTSSSEEIVPGKMYGIENIDDLDI